MGATRREESAPAGGLRRARVTALSGPRDVLLEIGSERFAATVAVPAYEPRVGDEVVVSRAPAFVLGVLRALRPAAPRRVEAADGASAAVDDDGVLRVRDPGGRLLFEHRGSRSVLSAPVGDLELAAPRGGVTVRAARAVRLEGDEGVRLSSRREVALGAPAATVRLDGAGAHLEAEHLEGTVRSTRAVFEDARLVADRLETAVNRAHHWVGTAELRGGRVVERLKESYRDVEGVAQLRAGRLRQVVAGLFSVLSGRATVQAEGDVSIDGDQIHLG